MLVKHRDFVRLALACSPLLNRYRIDKSRANVIQNLCRVYTFPLHIKVWSFKFKWPAEAGYMIQSQCRFKNFDLLWLPNSWPFCPRQADTCPAPMNMTHVPNHCEAQWLVLLLLTWRGVHRKKHTSTHVNAHTQQLFMQILWLEMNKDTFTFLWT